MRTISATYRVTTPMFLGGADQQAELRLPSFKGHSDFGGGLRPGIAAGMFVNFSKTKPLCSAAAMKTLVNRRF